MIGAWLTICIDYLVDSIKTISTAIRAQQEPGERRKAQ